MSPSVCYSSESTKSPPNAGSADVSSQASPEGGGLEPSVEQLSPSSSLLADGPGSPSSVAVTNQPAPKAMREGSPFLQDGFQ